jgi:hypothetical protein
MNRCINTFVKNKLNYWGKGKTLKEKKSLKKGYILYNCNPTCKNTLLEPGSPNRIPKGLCKKCTKDLSKLYTSQRKTIFKNKRNVLINGFHENTPKKLKKQLLKEGAISQCVPM